MGNALRSATVVLLAAAAADALGEGARDDDRGALRVATASRAGPYPMLTPLFYFGGFQTKTPCYEALVAVGPRGELAPNLLASWQVSEDGRTYRLRVREGVADHDGAPLDAAAVRDHLVRIRGNPGNRWLGSADLIESIDATDPATVVVTLARPWKLLRDLVAVNPGHVVAPGAFDHEGLQRRIVGTGPFRVTSYEPGVRIVYEAHDAWWRGRPRLRRVEMITLPSVHRESDEALRPVLVGDVDLVADGEAPLLPRDRLAEIAADPRFAVHVGPGSGTTFLRLQSREGPFASRDLRRKFAASLDRAAFVAGGERGYADATRSMFVPGFANWPEETPAAQTLSAQPSGARTRIVLLLPPDPSRRWLEHARTLREQAAAGGFDVAVEVAGSADEHQERLRTGAFDLAFATTHGTPYDPWISMRILFTDRGLDSGRTAARSGPLVEDAELERLVVEAFAAVSDDAERAALAAVQARLAEECRVVPLFTSRRVAVSRGGLQGFSFGRDGYDLGLGSVERVAARDR